MLVLALFTATACTSSEGGGDDDDDEGGGGSGGEDGSSDEGGDGDGEGGSGGANVSIGADPEECLGPRIEGCLYDVVVCEDGAWVCGDTPLVLSFHGDAPRFHAGADAPFDLSGVGQSAASDWPTADTPWLAIDVDRDGTIADGSEPFGSATRLASGGRAQHGFHALAQLDQNGDRRIDAADAAFGELALWSDANADRKTDRGELSSASTGARRIVSIDLDYRSEAVCDDRGNCGVERAAFTWMDASGVVHTGEVVDVHLPSRTR